MPGIKSIKNTRNIDTYNRIDPATGVFRLYSDRINTVSL
jgi:hypothetical protein